MPDPVLLTVNQMAELLACSPRSVYRACERRAIPFLRLGGRKHGPIRLDRDRVLEALEVPADHPQSVAS